MEFFWGGLGGLGFSFQVPESSSGALFRFRAAFFPSAAISLLFPPPVCSFMHIYAYKYMCVYSCMYICICIYVCMYTYTYIYIYMNRYRHTLIYVCMYVCVYVCVHVCVCVCACVCVCVCVPALWGRRPHVPEDAAGTQGSSEFRRLQTAGQGLDRVVREYSS